MGKTSSKKSGESSSAAESTDDAETTTETTTQDQGEGAKDESASGETMVIDGKTVSAEDADAALEQMLLELDTTTDDEEDSQDEGAGEGDDDQDDEELDDDAEELEDDDEELEDDQDDAEDDDAEGISQEDREKAFNALRRAGWKPATIDRMLDGDTEDRATAIDAAARFLETQKYIDGLREGGAQNDDGDGAEDTDDSQSNAEPNSGSSAESSSSPTLAALTAEFGEEVAREVQGYVSHAVTQERDTVREEISAEVRQSLAPFGQFLEQQWRREVGETHPEVLESEAAWKRVTERAEAIASVQDGSIVDHLRAAADEAKFKRAEKKAAQVSRSKKRKRGQPVVDGNRTTSDPATSDEAWEKYFEAKTAGRKGQAEKMKAIHDRLKKKGK